MSIIIFEATQCDLNEIKLICEINICVCFLFMTDTAPQVSFLMSRMRNARIKHVITMNNNYEKKFVCFICLLTSFLVHYINAKILFTLFDTMFWEDFGVSWRNAILVIFNRGFVYVQNATFSNIVLRLWMAWVFELRNKCLNSNWVLKRNLAKKTRDTAM